MCLLVKFKGHSLEIKCYGQYLRSVDGTWELKSNISLSATALLLMWVIRKLSTRPEYVNFLNQLARSVVIGHSDNNEIKRMVQIK